MVGTTISHYRVLEKIGEGGMGEVCRATGSPSARPYNITPDGQRFLMAFPADQADSVAETSDEQIHVVFNWLEELKKWVPVP